MMKRDLGELLYTFMLSRKLELAFYVVVSIMAVALMVISCLWVAHQLACFRS